MKLADIHATIDDMDAVITKALSGIDVRVWPCLLYTSKVVFPVPGGP